MKTSGGLADARLLSGVRKGIYIGRVWYTYPINGQRLPPFHQLDLRVDKVWTFPHWQFSVYLDVQNVYNRGNTEAIGYNYNYTQSNYVTGIPFLPNLGIRADF